jgi:transcriptional regulator with XRE-family HTH domain
MAGRPAQTDRNQFGVRLHALRQRAGLSQRQVAEELGLTQRAYSHWERYSVAVRPDQLQQLAAIFQVSVDELLGGTEKKKRAGSGPTGRMRRLFEQASKLPRSQQEKIAAVLEAFINQHSERGT